MPKLAVALLTVAFTCLVTVRADAADPSPVASPGAPAAALTKTASGLEYTDAVVGKGAAAKAGDTVSITYAIRVGDKPVERSKPGAPMVFTLGKGQALKGLDEGVTGMQAGGQRKLIVPPSLGYGAEAVKKVPPNSTMLIDVELLEIK